MVHCLVTPMTNQFKYDKKIAMTISSLRKLKGIKQITVSNALCVDQSVYSRIENGEINITPGQLRIIAHTLETSIFQIIALVEQEIDFSNTSLQKDSLPVLILNYILDFYSYITIDEYTIEDYQNAIKLLETKIKNLKD